MGNTLKICRALAPEVLLSGPVQTFTAAYWVRLERTVLTQTLLVLARMPQPPNPLQSDRMAQLLMDVDSHDSDHAHKCGRWENCWMFTSDELNRIKIFSCLEETERIRYAEKAADVRLCAGEWLIREGEPPWLSVLLEGRLRMARDVLGRQEDLNQYEYHRGWRELRRAGSYVLLSVMPLRSKSWCAAKDLS